MRRPSGESKIGVVVVMALLAVAHANGQMLSVPSRQPGAQDSTVTTTTLNAPETPREYFNAGTKLLKEGKLREAELFLENSLSSQDESLMPPALYNLGHVRFAQGIEELKKGPSASDALAPARLQSQMGRVANQQAEEALRDGIVEKMVSAYLRGAGTRREMRKALTAVKRALDAHSGALLKWQRSANDFHSGVELNSKDRQARHNAEVVDRHIAKLIDSLQQLQQMAASLSKEREELRNKLRQLKGRIPEPDMPPDSGGEEEEEEEESRTPKEGDQEAPMKEGQQIELTPEQANWLLEGFKLDRERRLPMGQNPGEPKDKNKPNW